MEKPKVIIRNRLTYVIHEDRVLVGMPGQQWVSYNPYENWNRAGITKFIEIISKSKNDEYGTAADCMTLAHECGIRGIGTRPPEL